MFFLQRRLLIRASLFCNFCVLTYVALQAAQGGGSHGGHGAASGQAGSAAGLADTFLPSGVHITYNGEPETASTGNGASGDSLPPPLQLPTETGDTEASTTIDMNSNSNTWSASSSSAAASASEPAVETVEAEPELRFPCRQANQDFSYTQRGPFWVLNNYIQADERGYRCNDSVTYTTHGDVTFLDNVVPLVRRWDGPLSMAVYTPGTDYDHAIESIAYLRQCTDRAVRQRVTFHLLLDERHFPSKIRKLHATQGSYLEQPAQTASSAGAASPGLAPTAETQQKHLVQVRSSNGQAVVRALRSVADNRAPSAGDASSVSSTSAKSADVATDDSGLPIVNCSMAAPWTTPPKKTYKQMRNLTYPVNVLRNIARQNAPTYYVLASDAELYPSPNLVADFMQMLRRNDSILNLDRPKIFVLPIFEVYGNQTVPNSKAELLEKLASGMALPFHQRVCNYCHTLPKSVEWRTVNITEGLHVFHIAKRHKPHQRWEPIYVGTQDDPLYDERLTWEGKSDKMTQGYALCMLDYDFMILDNAFLVHRPGVKIPRREPWRDAIAKKQSAVIRSNIFRELKSMYGANKDCII